MVPFVGLKLGIHHFDFELTDTFFESFEYSIVEKGQVKVGFDLEKKETMMVGEFTIEGQVDTACDRCNEPLSVPIDGEFKTVFKFDDQPSNDESLIIVYPEDFELDLRDHLLELVSVCLPSRSIHPEGECNEDMLDLIDEYTGAFEEEEETEETDPRWDSLKKLKNNDGT